MDGTTVSTATPTAEQGPGSTVRPARGIRVFRVLLGNETLKLRKRLAFWVTLGLFTFIHVMENGSAFLNARRDPERVHALPQAWEDILSGDSVIALIFGSVILILLLSNEFTWRTARQNVIDGLSKGQWFVGKLMLIPLLALVFVGIQVVVGGGFALAGTDLAAVSVPLLTGPVVQAIGGLVLSFLTLASLAFAVGLAVRSPGPAMAVWFFWITFGEQLVPGLLGRIVPVLGPVLGYLPFNAAQKLLAYESYDPAAFQRMADAALAAGRDAPSPPPDPGLAAIVCAGWALLFVLGSYAWFTRRDL